jgi:hypothetical protein
MRKDDSSGFSAVNLGQPCDGKNCGMGDIIMEMRDALIEMKSDMRHLRHAVKELQDDKKRVIWGALAALGSVVVGVIVWAVKQGAGPACIIALLCLSGCFSSNRQEQTATVKTTERVGIEQGQPTQITETVREQAVTNAHMDSGVDVAKAITAAMAGFKGDFLTAIAQLKPAEPPQGIDGLTGGIGAAAASLGLIALREFMARKKAQQDADDEWRRANESHAREVELAKQLPVKE